jgi:hypothetical protein
MKTRGLIAAAVAALLSAVAFGQAYNLFQPANGILKGQTTTYVTTSATSSDVINLFSGCSGVKYLGADGACHTISASAGGAANSVQYNNAGAFGGIALGVDQLLQGTIAAPQAVSVPNCGSSTQALAYSTTTHLFSCQTVSGGGGGTPGSPTNSVQFNSSGSFGGSSSFTYNGNTVNLIDAAGIPSLKLNAAAVGDTPLDMIGITSGGAVIKFDANNSDPTYTSYMGVAGAAGLFVPGADAKAMIFRGQGGFYFSRDGGTSSSFFMTNQGQLNVAVASSVPTMIVNQSTNPTTTPGLIVTGSQGTLSVVGNGVVGTSDSYISQDAAGAFNIADRQAQPINFLTNGSTKAAINSGVVVGSPTGGDKGVGSLNAQTLYIQGIAVGSGTGTVTSVGSGTGVTASPNPIIATGTLAVDQTFSPSWSGIHTFTGTANQIILNNATCGTNCKNTRIDLGAGGNLLVTSSNDATPGTAVTNALNLQRSGAAWSTLAFGNSTDNPSYSFQGTGTLSSGGSGNFTGTLTANTGGTSLKGSVTVSAGASTGLFVNPSSLTGDAEQINGGAGGQGTTIFRGNNADVGRIGGSGATNQIVTGSAAGDFVIAQQSTGTLRLATNSVDRMDIASDGGVIVGAATGASKGAGTLNATGLYVNGTAVGGGGAGGPTSFVRKGSDTSRNTTSTLANDPDLVFASVAAGSISVHCVILATTTQPAGSAGLKFGVQFLGSTTFNKLGATLVDNGQNIQGVSGDSNSAFGINSYPSAGSFTVIDLQVIAVTSTSGAVNFQWAQLTNNATNVTVKQGSWCTVQ